jgi:hypothetical protein
MATMIEFECGCCLDAYRSAVIRIDPPLPVRTRCDECVRVCPPAGGAEPECRRKAGAAAARDPGWWSKPR